MGYLAGQTSQSAGAIAIGENAGNVTQGISTVAIGDNAGQNNQGAYSIAIGNNAGVTNQPTNSIVLNATSSTINPTTTGFFVNPIRTLEPTSSYYQVYYNPTTDELVYSNTIGKGYFLVYGEYNGNWSQGLQWSFGAGVTTSLPIITPKSTIVGYNFSCRDAVTQATNIFIARNGTTNTTVTIPNNGTSVEATTGVSIAFALGDDVRIRFSNVAGAGGGGGVYRGSLIFRSD
jgi:hypothetical protein